MLTRTLRFLPALVLALALAISLLPTGFATAEDTAITVTAQYRQDAKVQLDTSGGTEISSLDPSFADDTISISVIENLFLGLTNVDPVTSEIKPELATSWTVEGTIWTFTLRNDVMWMQYDPASGTAEEIRPVVASDFVYGIKRGCDPRLGGYYGTISAKVIAGCEIVNGTAAEETTDDLVYGDTIKVTAPDDATVVVELQAEFGYFFSMTPMWMLRALPQEAIDEYGDEWTVPGNIITNGSYFVQENVRGVRRVFVRNTTMNPELLAGDGNIEVRVQTLIEDVGTAFALYRDDQLDAANVPTAEIQSVLGDPELSQEVVQIFDLAVFYFAFGHDKAPFDNVHARRAFSAIIDRQAYVDQVRQGRGVPMIHFTPPGMTHAPPINEIGVGFDPEFAAEQIALAGYPNCEGFPSIDVVVDQGGGATVEFWVAGAEQYLGCDPSLFNIEQLEFSVRLRVVGPDQPTQDRPHAWVAGWGPDYPDANNWVNDVLSCTAQNDFLRPCTEVDDLIDQAAREADFETRTQLYAQIEEAFFGPEGEQPIAPIYLRSGYALYKPWYTGPFETDGLFGGTHWEVYNLDMAAKLAARGQ